LSILDFKMEAFICAFEKTTVVKTKCPQLFIA